MMSSVNSGMERDAHAHFADFEIADLRVGRSYLRRLVQSPARKEEYEYANPDRHCDDNDPALHTK